MTPEQLGSIRIDVGGHPRSLRSIIGHFLVEFHPEAPVTYKEIDQWIPPVLDQVLYYITSQIKEIQQNEHSH